MKNKFVVGMLVEVTENISTIDGTLYQGEKCRVTGVTYLDKDYRISDNMGRIWYVMDYQIKKSIKTMSPGSSKEN